VGQAHRLPTVARDLDPGGEQIRDWLVEPDFATAGHFGQQGGCEDLGNRADLEEGVFVWRLSRILRGFPISEAKAVVANEESNS
jgi:hypothetical protein